MASRTSPLEDTGERMVPEASDARTFWEHIYRYRFAATFAPGRRVLDIACGEGYGTAALGAAGAVSVIGIDCSEAVCEHAGQRYGVDTRLGSAENIPLEDESVDLIISFETIEHIRHPVAFLDECLRVLAPGGTVIISTPNSAVFAAFGAISPFHCSEMTEAEFESLLRSRFVHCTFYGQGVPRAGWLSPRSIAALSAPWTRFPAAIRVRGLVRATFCPHLFGEVRSRQRDAAAQLVLQTDPAPCRFVNPYRIWERSRLLDAPVYVIGVGIKGWRGGRPDVLGEVGE